MGFFAVAADAYDRYMGRFSIRLAPLFADFAGVDGGMRVLDVGCGPGALTAELAARTGAERVAAVDPSEGFVETCRARVPGADVRHAAAEALPFDGGAFDAALAQLVLSFMRDADEAVASMRRVVEPGGTVAACMWDSSGKMELFTHFWEAASVFDVAAGADERRMLYRTTEEQVARFERAGLEQVETALLTVEAEYRDFEDLWESFGNAAGPVGAFVSKLDAEQRAVLRDGLERSLGRPAGSFSLSGSAWAVRGR
jgi:ubiquinone/menaquinone biosynthesis C-methylase UbiE